jgi:hypothetical protein
MTLKELYDLKEILSTDSISTTRLTVNDNFSKLRTGLSALIDSLHVNDGPDINVNSVSATNMVANSFSTPLPLGGTYKFTVNSNGEITATSILGKVVVETPRLRLDPDPTLIAFQAGEIRWSGTDFVGWNGSQWISFTAGANLVITAGPLVLNQLYRIVNYVVGDDFSNVGATNVTGNIFVATGITPTTWTHGSVLSSDNGEANTSSNTGTGIGLALSKAGVNLPFKSIKAGAGIFIDNFTDPYTLVISNIGATSGYSGVSGFSGLPGAAGTSGFSGTPGTIGTQGTSGFSGLPGLSGFSGIAASGFSGASGTSGISTSGFSGTTGVSGFSGVGVSGFSGISGAQGNQGDPGPIGNIGPMGNDGASGFSGFSGGPGAPVLGPAEDGSYLDGFWPDLTPLTPVGTFADRVNEILLALLPPPAPHLSNWSQTTLGLSVPGNLSFDSSHALLGYTNADSATPPVSVDQLFTVSGKRLGITQQVGGTKLSGVLNNQVITGPGTPNPAYPAQTFGDAEKGFLRIYINGTELVSKAIDLTSTTSSIDTTASGTVTGISVSAQGTVVFANGTPLPTFQYRTGTWNVSKSDLSLGYNIIEIKHVVTLLDIRALLGFEVVVDGDTTATSFASESLFNAAMGSPKKVSGIEYHQAGTLQYNITINNAYRNTYSASSSAVSFTGYSNTYGTILTAPAQALGPNSGNPALAVSVIGKIATVNSPGKRVINEALTLATNVLRTVQGTTSSVGGSMPGFLIDNVAPTSTQTFEGFDDENYRLNTNSAYNLVADVTTVSNIWDSIQSLVDGSAGHTDGLQVIGGKLIFPGSNGSFPSDFRTSFIPNASTFNNGGTGGSGRNYGGITGTRYFIRKFQQISPTTGNFVMTINGTGGTFVPLTTPLTGTNVHVEVKGPSQTGWMDAYGDFITANWADGNGARSASGGAGRAFGTAWGLTIGTKNTSATGGYMLIRISVSDSFTGSFDSITFSFV